MSIGDVFDRYSICKLKSQRLGLDNSTEMHELYQEMIEREDLLFYAEKLYIVNGSIWDLEADIRNGNEEILGLEEIGRRAIMIRGLNNYRVFLKNEINSKAGTGYIEVKMNHGSQRDPKAIISLTTVPERLIRENANGLKAVLKSLCEQKDDDYGVHFNIPNTYNITNEPYIIPSWMDEYKLKYPHLKIFRTEDFGPPTKLIPTLLRNIDPEAIIIVVDDDLIYHHDMVSEHKKYQEKIVDSAICYDGDGSIYPVYGDIRDESMWVTSVSFVRETKGLEHFKSASYKKKLFTQDFFDYYVGKTLSDDILVSRYFRDNGIKMYVVPYDIEIPLYATRELWDLYEGVTTFPVLKYADDVPNSGCNHPEILKIQPKFYIPEDLGKKD